jgi:hypothetical protein
VIVTRPCGRDPKRSVSSALVRVLPAAVVPDSEKAISPISVIDFVHSASATLSSNPSASRPASTGAVLSYQTETSGPVSWPKVEKLTLVTSSPSSRRTDSACSCARVLSSNGSHPARTSTASSAAAMTRAERESRCTSGPPRDHREPGLLVRSDAMALRVKALSVDPAEIYWDEAAASCSMRAPRERATRERIVPTGQSQTLAASA